jgi:uncharacterized Zn-binding protein involved in type VI secretion
VTGCFAVQDGATVVCAHLGQAKPGPVNARVRLGGHATIALGSLWSVDRCSPPSGPPCVKAFWISGSSRVTSMGKPLVIQGGTAMCLPTLVPLVVQTVQNRVTMA